VNGHRPSRQGGGSPLDVVGWFNGWLGRRRNSLRNAAPRLQVRTPNPIRDETRDLFRRGVDAVSSDVFDRAFRRVVGGTENDADYEIEAVDLPVDAEAFSQTVPGDLTAPPPSDDWLTEPTDVFRRGVLFQWLDRWYRETNMDTIGGVGEFVRRPWIRASIGAVSCHLNANTTRAGVARYLELARSEGEKLPWFVVSGRGGLINEVAVGREQVRIRGFHLFTDSVFRHSGRIGGARPGETERRAAQEASSGVVRRMSQVRSLGTPGGAQQAQG